MKIGQKYKIEKPKTEEELVLSAEGLTVIMFNSQTDDTEEETKETKEKKETEETVEVGPGADLGEKSLETEENADTPGT